MLFGLLSVYVLFCFAGKRSFQRVCSLSNRRFSQNVQLYLPLCKFTLFKLVKIESSPIVCGWCNLFWQEDEKQESHFHISVSCIAQSLKSHIINRSNDEIAICFFNTVSSWKNTVFVFVFFLFFFYSLGFCCQLAAWKEESSRPEWCLCL